MGCPTALELALVPVPSMINLSMGGLYSISQLQGRRQLMSNVVRNHEKWHDDWSVRRAAGGGGVTLLLRRQSRIFEPTRKRCHVRERGWCLAAMAAAAMAAAQDAEAG